ncbi:MAG: hypothetical protein P1V97_30130 [Planctomycetota bacterium]|nr:hypothetical protein [Planctomycetota bacterium]
MSFIDRLKKVFQSGSGEKRLSVSLLTGHTVSYRLTQDDEESLVIRFRCLGVNRSEPGAWVVLADMRQGAVQSVAMFRVPDRGPHLAALRATPMKAEILFGDGGESPMVAVESQMLVAQKLLNARHHELVAASLESLVTMDSTPSGVEEIFSYTDARPTLNYEERFFLSPQVPITGLAGSSLAQKNYQIRLQGFGCHNAHPQWIGSWDYIDWEHSRPIQYENIQVSLPEAWLLAPLVRDHPQLVQKASKDEMGSLELTTTEGGQSCLVNVFVSCFEGGEGELKERAALILGRVREDKGGQGSQVVIDKKGERGQDLLLLELPGEEKTGLATCALIFNKERNQFAKVSANHFISNDHPQRESCLTKAREVFLEMINSFEFINK